MSAWSCISLAALTLIGLVLSCNRRRILRSKEHDYARALRSSLGSPRRWLRNADGDFRRPRFGTFRKVRRALFSAERRSCGLSPRRDRAGGGEVPRRLSFAAAWIELSHRAADVPALPGCGGDRARLLDPHAGEPCRRVQVGEL